LVQQVPVGQHVPDSQQAAEQKQSPPASQAQPASMQTHSSHLQTTQQSHGEADCVESAVDERNAEFANGETSNSARIDKENVFMEILQSDFRNKIEQEMKTQH
jgi:hypothetical protein